MNLRVGLGLLLVSMLSGCAVNPVTGEQDFVMMSERQELELGRRYSQEVLRDYPRYADESLQAYVQQVGERVARNSHRSNLRYQFTVVDSPQVNAFALPGGYIYVNRGLLAYLKSEAQLAAVLGHELGHVTARHGVRQQSQAQAWGIAGQLLAIGTGVGAAADLTSVLGSAIVSGYGRDMELEADGLGAQYLARSGYDPQAMIEVVEVLKAQEDFARDQARQKGKAVPPAGYHGLFDTHPDNDTRLQKVIGPARALAGGQQEVNQAAFLRRLEGLPFGDSEASGVRRGQRFYHAGLDFVLDIPPGWDLQNQPDALIIHRPDEQAFIAMALESADPRLAPEQLLRQKVGAQRLALEERLQLHGMSGVTAILPGRPARRVALILRAGNAYAFVAAVKDGSPLESEDEQFLSVIKSFRPLAKGEQKLAQPVRLHLLEVKPGDTVERLAGGSGLPGDQSAQIRLLNSLYPDRQPEPGTLLKVLR